MLRCQNGYQASHCQCKQEQFTSDDYRVIQSAVDSAWDFLDKHFKIDYDIDLVITEPLSILPTIPEDGITARAYKSDYIMLGIDKSQHEVSEDLLFEIICHEMAHSMRWDRVPEFANTLFENAIMEGLAIVLEETALKSGRTKQQFFLTAVQETSKATIDLITREFKDRLHSKHFDYEKDFFAGDKNLPRWSAYALGYHLVKGYLDKTNDSIFDATIASYSEFKKVLEE
jgi:uncharacterized protein YjaZ